MASRSSGMAFSMSKGFFLAFFMARSSRFIKTDGRGHVEGICKKPRELVVVNHRGHLDQGGLFSFLPLCRLPTRMATVLNNHVYHVSSSNIATIRYDIPSETLIVEFVNGSGYAYDDVPRDVVEDWLDAPSKGVYHHKHIKYSYNFHKLY